MTLRHPRDLEAWHRWQRSRQRLRRLRHARRPAPPERAFLTTYGADPQLLVALDSQSPTSSSSLIEPLAHLDLPFAVLSPGPRPASVRGHGSSKEIESRDLPPALVGIRAAVALGHYMTRGALAHRWTVESDVPYFVSQHGALTPYAPPLPIGARLLAWSEADADFWKSGRSDIQHDVVGSQILWQAERCPSAADDGVTYLGQMHAAELSRSRLARAAAAFCREHGATYRPHPSEQDKLSRLTHAGYRRLGIDVEGASPLAELTGPVVSVFSTGVLEAAAQGRDAWVQFPRPPAWLGEFWERYGMHRFGDVPTPAPVRPAEEPAQRIATILREAVS